MTTTTRMTTLEAVNLMLSAIGEAPVNSIESPVLSDVALAKKDLDNACRQLMQRGWDFNTDVERVFPPDSLTGAIALPANTLKVDASDSSRWVTQRGGYLYDKESNTNVFTSPVTLDIVYLYDFDDLPAHAQQYILMKAARQFQKGALGGEGGKYSEADEQRAWIDFSAIETDNRDHNIIRDDAAVANALDRY